MSLSKERLEARLNELERELDTGKMQIATINGAVLLTKELITEIDASVEKPIEAETIEDVSS